MSRLVDEQRREDALHAQMEESRQWRRMQDQAVALKFEGVALREIARRMGISVWQVEKVLVCAKFHTRPASVLRAWLHSCDKREVPTGPPGEIPVSADGEDLPGRSSPPAEKEIYRGLADPGAATRIRDLLALRGMTVYQLAKKSRVGLSTAHTAVRGIFTPRTSQRIARALGVEVSFLLVGAEEARDGNQEA